MRVNRINVTVVHIELVGLTKGYTNHEGFVDSVLALVTEAGGKYYVT